MIDSPILLTLLTGTLILGFASVSAGQGTTT